MKAAQVLARWEIEELERQARRVDLTGLSALELVKELERLTKGD